MSQRRARVVSEVEFFPETEEAKQSRRPSAGDQDSKVSPHLHPHPRPPPPNTLRSPLETQMPSVRPSFRFLQVA